MNPRLIKTQLIRGCLGALLLLSAAACIRVSEKHSKRTPRQGVTDAQATPTPSPSPTPSPTVAPSQMKFRVFDPAYNFLHTSLSSPDVAKSQFPVFSGAEAQVSLLRQDDLVALRTQLLDGAVKSVRIQTLVFWADDAGWFFADKLVELKKRGIDVRIIVDATSNLDTATQRMYYYLRRNGIPIEGYDPFYLWPLAQTSRNVSVSDNMNDLNRRYHEKIFVVDGEIPERATAIMGGTNWSRHYLRVDSGDPFYMWQDQDIMLKGSAATLLTQMFDANQADLIAFRKKEGYLDFDDFWTLLQAKSQLFNENDISVKRPNPVPWVVDDIKRHLTIQPVVSLAQPEKMRILHNRPRQNEFYLGDVYVDMIMSATKTIDIANAYFIPDQSTIDAIKQAVRRGVTVRVITNSVETSEFTMVAEASRSTYKDLLAVNSENVPGGAHVEIYEWLGDRILHNGEGHLHAKFAVFDQEASIVGSFNLDPRSRDQNTENLAVILNTPIATSLGNHFAQMITPQYAGRITPEQAAQFLMPTGFFDAIRKGTIPLIKPFL